MEILILGLQDHRIQEAPRSFRDPLREQQRRQLELLLRRVVQSRKVDFIGEETYPARNTIAKQVAHCLGFRWVAIEMSERARDELGIAEEQRTRPASPNESRVASDAIREEFMVWKTLKEAVSAQSILVVCGLMHTHALAERFRKAGYEPDIQDLCDSLRPPKGEVTATRAFRL
jgi:hypothetical protein